MSDVNAALLALIDNLPKKQKAELLALLGKDGGAAAKKVDGRKKPRNTPFANLWRSLDPEEKAMFAAASDTTVSYLQQLAGNDRPNPSLRLAAGVVRASAERGTPLTFEDLLIGAGDAVKDRPNPAPEC